MKIVKIGVVGLGRLGYQHAINIATKTQSAQLLAICDLDESKVNKIANELSVKYRYTNFEEMLNNKEIDAVVIVSPSGMHVNQIEKALKYNKHVFCEKPLGVTIDECKKIEKVVEEHLHLVFMLGFMRRFDESYKYAKEKIDNGEIGKIILFRSYSQDPKKLIDGALSFAPYSGGQFLDMAVHDIDLARWFIGSEVESVYALGGCYEYEEFSKYNDGDNVSCLMKFKDNTMGFLFAGRTAPHGYNVETEIIGTKGILRIGSVPQKNLVEILDDSGVRKECSGNFIERFEKSFEAEMKEFINCITENKKPEITVYDGTKVSQVAYKCKESFESGKMMYLEY